MINKILHWLGFACAILVIIWVVVLSLLFMFNPLLQKHKADIERFASTLLQNQVEFTALEIGNHGMDPVLKIDNFTLSDVVNHKQILQAKKLVIGIDLFGSLYARQIVPGFLLIDGTNLTFPQKTAVNTASDGTGNVENILSKITASNFGKKFSWLLSQGKIVIQNTQLNIGAEDASTVSVKIYNAELSNSIFYRQLKMHGVVEKHGIATDVIAQLKYHGAVLQNKLHDITGKIALNNLELNLQNSAKKSPFLSNLEEAKIQLHLTNSKIIYARLFRQPLLVDDAFTNVKWQKLADKQVFDIAELHARNSELDINGKTNVIVPLTGSPIFDMQLNFTGQNIARAKLYYPVGIMDDELIAWLDKAFIRGQAISGVLVLRGASSDFPFDHNNGRFFINTAVRDLDFNYYPGWPIFEGLNGNIIFDGRSMRVNATSGKIVGAAVNQVSATIPNLSNAMLDVNGTISADSGYGVRFLLSSPLKKLIDGDWLKIKLHGSMELGLHLLIPLHDGIKQTLQVVGEVKLQDNILTIPSWHLDLDSINGDLQFTQDTITSNNFTAELYNKPLQIKASPQVGANQQKFTQLEISGNADVPTLSKIAGFDLTSYATGAADFFAKFQVFPTENLVNNNLSVVSDLRGINVKLPHPFAKTNNENMPLKLDLNYGNAMPTLKFNYGPNLAAILHFASHDGNNEFKSGQINLGLIDANNIAETNAVGLGIYGHLTDVAWSDWSNILFSHKSNAGLDFSRILNKVDLTIDKLNVFSQTLQAAKITAVADANNLSLKINSPKVLGTIVFPQDYPKQMMRCDFQKIYLEKNNSNALDGSGVNPNDLAAFHFASDDFRYGSTNYGKILLETSMSKKQGNILNIDKLQINTPLYNLNARGYWQKNVATQHTFLQGNVTSKNVGNAVQQLGYTQSLVGGDGGIDFSLTWPGIFYNPTFAATKGDLNIQVKDGRIVNLGTKTEAEMGIGRILGILSLQSLPRRLSLDFSDLVKSGFSFDMLRGTFHLLNGNVTTTDTKLSGPVAKVNMVGRIGFVAKDLAINLVVMPNITSSLPVIATVAGGPIAGAVTWLVDKTILNKGVGAMAAHKYQITGSWLNPVIQ